MKVFYFAAALIITAILIYGGTAWLTGYYKDKGISKVKKDFYKLVPVTIFIFALLFFQSLFNSSFLTKPIRNDEDITTIQDAGKRIKELERYTESLEIDLDYARFSLYLLIGTAFLLYSFPLVQIVIGWSKESENK